MSVVNFEARLPDELWLAILKECDVPTKLACSLTNRRLSRLSQEDSVWPPLTPTSENTPSRRDGWLGHLHQIGNAALVAPRRSLLPQKRSNAREVYRTNARAVANFTYARGQMLRLSGLAHTQEGKRILEECLTAHKLWDRQQRAVNIREPVFLGKREGDKLPESLSSEQTKRVPFRNRGFSQ